MKTARKTSVIYLVSLLAGISSCPKAHAGSATWKPTPANSDWNNADNWMPATVPDSPADVATFGSSDTTDISIANGFNISGIVFDLGASAYVITNITSVLITGAGITNDSAVTQSFQAVGALSFAEEADAGSRVVITTSGQGSAVFGDTATAGSATFINQGATNGSTDSGQTVFLSHSSAANSTIINKPPQEGASNGGSTYFAEFATGANSVIRTEGGITIFAVHSTAGNATLLASGDGKVDFEGSSDGGTARVRLLSPGNLDISPHFGALVTIGSLQGDGTVYLGQRSLAVGSNSLSTTFSGVIRETGGIEGGHGGKLSKVGSGLFTLSGANLYAGGTTVSAGSLILINTTGSGTGTGAVSVNAGTLGGSGTIAGAVMVGTGSGSGAFLAPAASATKPTTLTIQSALTFKADSTYSYTLRAKRRKSQSDQVIAKGVTIESGAQFNFVGTVQGKLRQGTSFSVISNTASTPISGTFANLPDGAILSVGGNSLRASYQVGDGNDLTLTVQ